MRRSLIAAGVLSLVAAACSGAGDTSPSTAALVPTTTPAVSASPGDATTILLTGSIEIPGAGSFGDPGFHEVVVMTGSLPDAAAGRSGELVVTLNDAGRPDQTCDRDHPLSGCITIDWSDFEGRPECRQVEYSTITSTW